MAEDWITTQEASEISGYTADHIRDLIQAERIKAKKFGIVWQVSRKSLDAYLKEQQSKGEKRGRKTN